MNQNAGMGDDALQALAARVRELEDKDEIRQLYVDYGRHLDAGDAAAYASLFSPDGKLRIGGIMRGDGPEEIEQAARKISTVGPEGQRNAAHVIGAPHIELDGDTAIGEAVWVAILRSESGPPTVSVGRHVDKLVREDGRWRFAERRGFLDVGSVG